MVNVLYTNGVKYTYVPYCVTMYVCGYTVPSILLWDKNKNSFV